MGTSGNFVTHEYANLVNRLPGLFEGQEAADLEGAGCDVDARRELAPVAEVVADSPHVVAVVDDEQVAARFRFVVSQCRLSARP